MIYIRSQVIFDQTIKNIQKIYERLHPEQFAHRGNGK
jgi:hypothetical protein